MSDLSGMTNEALVEQFYTNVYRYESDRSPSPWKERVDTLEAELLRRLNHPPAPSREVMVEGVDKGVVFDDSLTDMQVKDVRRVLESVHRAINRLYDAAEKGAGDA